MMHCRSKPESVYAPVSSFELRINKAREEYVWAGNAKCKRQWIWPIKLFLIDIKTSVLARVHINW